MADKRQSLDVWIVETNTVYRDVPFTVVIDWVQQGRLLENDQLRPSGTKDWQLLSLLPSIAAYLPKVERFRTEDQAEALEPVQVDFVWKPRQPDDEGDVDMIPLIDVSLVLLIFFMMTASTSSARALIDTPKTQYGTELSNDPTMLWIGVDRNALGDPTYSLGTGDHGAAAEDRNLSEAEVLQRLDSKLGSAGAAEVRIAAHQGLPYGVIQDLTLAVEKRRPKVRRIYTEVSESANK